MIKWKISIYKQSLPLLINCKYNVWKWRLSVTEENSYLRSICKYLAFLRNITFNRNRPRSIFPQIIIIKRCFREAEFFARYAPKIEFLITVPQAVFLSTPTQCRIFAQLFRALHDFVYKYSENQKMYMNREHHVYISKFFERTWVN